ncbi:Ubiquitin carboxyl-terminal hydrolase 10, partial [Galemys pyrenaicus]
AASPASPASTGPRRRVSQSTQPAPAAHAHLSAAHAQRASLARPASPRPAARGQCAGAAADASVPVRAIRWRRRGKQREESEARRGSLKRAAMALRKPQVATGPRPRRDGVPGGGPAGADAGGRAGAPCPERACGSGGGRRDTLPGTRPRASRRFCTRAAGALPGEGWGCEGVNSSGGPSAQGVEMGSDGDLPLGRWGGGDAWEPPGAAEPPRQLSGRPSARNEPQRLGSPKGSANDEACEQWVSKPEVCWLGSGGETGLCTWCCGEESSLTAPAFLWASKQPYIFGDFSPDEFNQFFVTPRSSVELPPYNGTVACGAQAVDELPDGPEYQRIEFGVNEVIGPSDTLPRTPNYSISSTLNPQAPEFILSCTTSKKTPADIDKGVNCSSVDCQYPHSSLVLDSGSNAEGDVLENDGVSGGLGQRERKKKKKRPPGYYSYLKDGSEGGVSTEALVNGHASPAVLNSTGTEDVEVMGHMPPPVSPRTCSSPQDPMGFINDAVPGGSFPGALDGGARTAGQPEGCHRADCEQSCLPAEAGGDSLLRTAVAQSCVGTDTTENLGVANGQILESSGQGSAANGVVSHPGESTDSDLVKADSLCSPADPQVSAGALPGSQPAKSWASLFHDSKPASSLPVASVETKYPPPATSPMVSEKQVEVKEGLVPVSEDPVAIKIAGIVQKVQARKLLENVTLVHKPVSLQPRGLINKGNWCYINAYLQNPGKVSGSETLRPQHGVGGDLFEAGSCVWCTPVRFTVLCGWVETLGDKIVRDIRPGAAFEPTYIYRLLTVIKSSLSEKGRQEDAEEYLGFILNGLHEEMLTLKKLLSPSNEKLNISNGPKSHSVNEEEQEEEGAGSEDEWEQVGPRNKTSVTRQADFVQTPITGIFGGHIRSVVYQQSSKESATLQPFFTLQLDIQSDKIRTVQDALESLVARESVQGYTTKTKQEVEISRRVTLEKLPPVLVLHLKRFVYEKTGGCQKLVKNIEYPVDLEISKELLSPGVKNKNFKCHRTYRLFAVTSLRPTALGGSPSLGVHCISLGLCGPSLPVVYHHGSSATGGHYTTDVFQIGLNGWLRIDDQTVKVIHQYQVVKPAADRTAYLLYYRRVDLL